MVNEVLNWIYPGRDGWYFGNHADLTNSYCIHFFSEGFSDIRAFNDAVVKVWEQLLEIAPFNYIGEGAKVFFSCYEYWPDANVNTSNLGPLLVSDPAHAPTNRTNYNSYLYPNPDSGGPDYFISFDKAKFISSIQETKVPLIQQSLPGAVSQLDVANLKDYVVYHDPNPYSFQQNSISILLYPDILPTGLTIDGIEFDMNVEPGMKVYLLNASDNAGKFVARAMAKAMGLATESSYSSPQATTPVTDGQKLFLELAPNLVYLPGITSPYIPTWDFKWSNDVADTAYSSGITVHTTGTGRPANQVSSKKAELWKGGGGFTDDVYRSGEHCLMDSIINNVGSHAVKSAHKDFCPVCNNYITNLLGKANVNIFGGPISLFNQPLKFDEVNWVTKTVLMEGANIDYTHAFDSPPTGVNTEYWRFDLESSMVNPLRLTNIKVKNQQRPSVRVVEDVMSSISFENLKILFEGESTAVDFPVSQAFGIGQVKLEVYENSENLDTGNLFQKGAKLTMKYDFGGTCNVTVALSVVFRGRQNDFDPGGAAFATKFYPQIQFSWTPGKTNPKTVKSFEGHIAMDCNTHHADSNPTCLPTKMNFVELFTDSNTSIVSSDQNNRKHKYRLRVDHMNSEQLAPVIPLAQWSFLFDYYRAMTNEIGGQDTFDETWTVVHGPGAGTKYTDPRRLAMDHLNDSPLLFPDNFVINKVPRQGAYDNIHVTGDMGLHQSEPNMDPEPYLYEGASNYPAARLLAAPFCAEDCIHIHFRWGNIAKYLATVMRTEISQFKGWAPNPLMSLKGSSSEQPLAPPNQEVKIRAINPSGGGKTKKLIYQAVITKPLPASKNVIFEQGGAYAVEANSVFVKVLKSFYAFAPELLCPDKIGAGVFFLDDYVFMRKMYARIRFAETIPDTGSLSVSTATPQAIINTSGQNLENL